MSSENAVITADQPEPYTDPDERYDREAQERLDNLAANLKRLQSAVMYSIAYLECCQLSGPDKHGRAITELREVLKATGFRA